MTGLEWRYTPGGQVRHALTRSSDAGAVCGIYLLPASDWLGTGSQGEYERVEALRPCLRCVRKLGDR
ncbi:hypothetical protein AB0J14_04400 [Micromonospora arborensis]|uniref:hypothetical protein n=1 Tax=Micromonospora arborensis TaxID=2116518 RepID=UPI0033DCA43B